MKTFRSVLCVVLSSSVAAFAPSRLPPMSPSSTDRHNPKCRASQEVTTATALHMQQFDISKPVFDLYAFRSIRGDALAKYNSLNQSEPLRINLSALFCLFFLSLPTLADEVNGVPFTLPQTGISFLAAVGCAGLFVRESQKRSRQLTRMEKELFARDLELRPPANLLADRPFGDALTIRAIQEYGGGPRIVALCSATADQMNKILGELKVFGRRLAQANVLVVPIVKDNGMLTIERNEWLATAESPSTWQTYFDSLGETNGSDATFKWFGLSSTGRSFGSGVGEPPSWLQLMGQHLRPLDVLDLEEVQGKDAASDPIVQAILATQQEFYDALTNGKLEQLQSVFVDDKTKQVSDVIDQGGRLDSWQFCLEDGARPEGMKIGNSDVTLETETRAFSTAIEFPVADGLTDARLLAFQEWQRSDSSSEWKLVSHQTIPWSVDVAAAGTLICDCRGCVSLVRGNQRRTFGGLIG